MILCHWDTCQTSNLQKSKIRHRFKVLCLWSFVTSTIENKYYYLRKLRPLVTELKRHTRLKSQRSKGRPREPGCCFISGWVSTSAVLCVCMCVYACYETAAVSFLFQIMPYKKEDGNLVQPRQTDTSQSPCHRLLLWFFFLFSFLPFEEINIKLIDFQKFLS